MLAYVSQVLRTPVFSMTLGFLLIVLQRNQPATQACFALPQLPTMNKVNITLFFAALLVIGACAEPRKLLASNEGAQLTDASEHQRILAELEEVHQLRERMLQEGEIPFVLPPVTIYVCSSMVYRHYLCVVPWSDCTGMKAFLQLHLASTYIFYSVCSLVDCHSVLQMPMRCLLYSRHTVAMIIPALLQLKKCLLSPVPAKPVPSCFVCHTESPVVVAAAMYTPGMGGAPAPAPMAEPEAESEPM